MIYVKLYKNIFLFINENTLPKLDFRYDFLKFRTLNSDSTEVQKPIYC